MKKLKDFLNEGKKTKSASRVLQLMDKDWSYTDALRKVAKDDNISKEQLEKDLEPYI